MSRARSKQSITSLSERLTRPLSAQMSVIMTKGPRVEIKPKPPPPPPPLPKPPPKEPDEIPQRIFLYLKTLKVDNLPPLVDDHDAVLRLKHGNNTITKIEDHYTGKTDANLSSIDKEMPAYSIRINQDNIEDLNSVCDTPLMITIYEYIPKGRIARRSMFKFDSMDSLKVEFEDVDDDIDEIATEGQFFPVAQGNLDLLQFFSQNKTSALENIFLYSTSVSKTPVTIPTCKITMQVTAVLPLLKNISFCNVAFITFESIYNSKPDVLNAEPIDLMVDLSFQSKTNPNNKVKLCSFSMFSKSIISEQNIKHKWENMKDKDVNATSLGAYSELSLSLHKLFVGVLGASGVDFKFDEILQDVDYALVCNSVHRFALTKELSAILEDVIAFNEQHILVEIYHENNPNKILLEGICDLSIFLYPKVNACRFAVELKSPKRKSKISAEPNKDIPKRNSSLRSSVRQSTLPQRPTFAILNFCLLTPITEVPESISKFNENLDKRELLKKCNPKSDPTTGLSLSMKKEQCYQEIDEIVQKLINYIIEKNIRQTLDAKEYLCCQLGNIVNKIIKLIASDFNIRIPTKSNIEFVNLTTTVYKELEQRWHDILQGCDDNNLDECFSQSEEKVWKIREAMSMAKLTFEAGKEELGSFILEKIKKKHPESTELNFYIFIYDMEKLDYVAAKEYLNKPFKQKLKGSEYYSEMTRIYIEYMENLQQEETAENAFEALLKTVKGFIENYPKEIDFWILLHSLYSSSSYLPGMEFTRWKCEYLYKHSGKELPLLPKSRWSMSNNYKLTVTNTKGIKFYGVMEKFLNLGLYKFAEIVFNQLSPECSDFEKYLMTITFSIFQNTESSPVKYASKRTGSTKDGGDDEKAYQALINGNLEYYRGNIVTAMENYDKLLNLKLPPLSQDFQLGLLRLGFHMLEIDRKYHTAQKAFEKSRSNNDSCMIADFGLGKTMYKLGDLKKALNNFAGATTYSMHIPDVWGYLALINLKLGNNFKALECWKYAKLDPKNIISDDILEELSAINPSDVMLYVDMPEECQSRIN